MKRCSRCGVEKPATGEFFPPNKRRQDGFQSQCRKCAQAVCDRCHAANPESVRAAVARYRAANPEAYKAHGVVDYAVRIGRLVVPAVCEGCGQPSSRLEKHHADYSRPLEVKFLCWRCHKAVHQRSREASGSVIS
jgi:hypothetical protein